ncbi:MAG: TnsA endonuclease N-terminal domain-containing protein [Clostridiales bacterium]|nr:TnsA endonuclease N-terminal domain-containing protein [Clostridiales bacterium]
MPKRKSVKTKLKESRCQGIGPDYVPFYMANEGGSSGTCSMIYDPREGRMVHCLSRTETMCYRMLTWQRDVLHIREQFLLDHDLVNEAREKLGYSRIPETLVYTTDFLVTYRDGHEAAFSVKYSEKEFDRNSKQYEGREYRYDSLVMRQNTEREYWESQGVSFSIVTRELLMKYQIRIMNIALVMGFYDEIYISSKEQKLLYLIAHHYVDVDMDTEPLNPKKLAASMPFDIDAVYEKAVKLREAITGE